MTDMLIRFMEKRCDWQNDAVDLHPTVCNLCGGEVILISNALIYGKPRGSGKCYVCTCCGARVGTHIRKSNEAFGILSDKEMRNARMRCHELLDIHWRHKKRKVKYRSAMYKWLAKKMQIDSKDCHIGCFDMEKLNKAIEILEKVKYAEAKIDKRGNLNFRDLPKERRPAV